MFIGKDWKISSDKLNVILSKRKTRKSKKDGNTYEDWEEIGYYSTVSNALKGLVNFEVKETGLKDLRVVVDKINELGKQIDQATSGESYGHKR